jgi:hypothetical protein
MLSVSPSVLTLRRGVVIGKGLEERLHSFGACEKRAEEQMVSEPERWDIHAHKLVSARGGQYAP